MNDDDIDWSDCPCVAINPDFGGHPVVTGIERLPVEALVLNHLDGLSIEDVAFMFECPVQIVRAIIVYFALATADPAKGIEIDADTPDDVVDRFLGTAL